MWLLLCSSDDHPALWAARRLRARGLSPLLVLTPELLHYSFKWSHRLGNTDHPSIEFTLADGLRVRGEEIRGVLNRMPVLPSRLVSGLPAADRAYALQEWAALHISWLSSLQVPVLNLPVVNGLGGAWHSHAQWTWFAARAGLATPPFREEPASPLQRPTPILAPGGSCQAFVVDGEVAGNDLPAHVRNGLCRLAELARIRLIGVSLEPGTHRFLGATPRPDLRLGGDALLDALSRALSVG